MRKSAVFGQGLGHLLIVRLPLLSIRQIGARLWTPILGHRTLLFGRVRRDILPEVKGFVANPRTQSLQICSSLTIKAMLVLSLLRHLILLVLVVVDCGALTMVLNQVVVLLYDRL